jgi:hypothetical protein
MNTCLIINFQEWMGFQVYKYEGCSHHNIDNKIVDASAFILVESGFQESWMEWLILGLESSRLIYTKKIIILIWSIFKF